MTEKERKAAEARVRVLQLLLEDQQRRTPAEMAAERMQELNLMVPPEQTAAARELAPGIAREMAVGATLGSLDEILGGMRGLQSLATGGEFMPAAKETMAQFSAEREKFKEKYPYTALGAEIAGSLPTAKRLIPTTGGPLAQIAGPAGLGAGYGFMATEGDLAERAKGGLISGAMGGALGVAGQAIPAVVGKTTEAAKGLISRGMELTPGQALGRGAKFVEDVLGKTLLGEIGGVGAAQRRAFESFNRAFIEEQLAPIGFKLPANVTTTSRAVEAADEAIRVAFKQAKAEGMVENATPIVNIIKNALSDDAIRAAEIPPKLAKKAIAKILNKAVLTRIEDNTISGDFLQGALASLYDASKKITSGEGGKIGKGLDRDVRLAMSRYLNSIQKEIMDAAVAQNPNNVALANVRKAYPAYLAVKKAMAKPELASPKKAMEAMQSIGRTYASRMPGYRMAETAREVLGETPPPSEAAKRVSRIGFPSFLSLGQAAGAYADPLTSGLVAGGLSGLYRTGAAGSQIGRGLLQTPGFLAETAARTPSAYGMLGPAIAGE